MNLNLNGMVSMWKMRELVDKATNIVMNYTETEAKVMREYLHLRGYSEDEDAADTSTVKLCHWDLGEVTHSGCLGTLFHIF